MFFILIFIFFNFTNLLSSCSDKTNTNEKNRIKQIELANFYKKKGEVLLKNKKYELGISYINQSVKISPKLMQPFRAFAKCIYLKEYDNAIVDFEDCKTKWGDNYIEGHKYNFYIGLCYLQTNKYENAESMFKKNNKHNSTELFYSGIVKFKLKKYKQAIQEFDKALKVYHNFSEAQFYKSICLSKFDKYSEALNVLDEGKQNAANKYTLKEPWVEFESFPYQVVW